jgi:pimeloyl-ACP methyl ester carboxylesterase
VTEPVEIAMRDGIVLRGELEGHGDGWLVLVHDVGSDLDFWRPLSLAGERVTVLSVDLRGHGGSDGDAAAALDALDLLDVIAFARARGAHATVVGAAGRVVEPALAAAAEAGASGLVAIGPLAGEVDGRPLQKLVIVASKEPEQVAAGAAIQRRSGATILVNLPIAGGPEELVSGAWRTNVRAYMLAFVRDAASAVSGVVS